MRKISFVPASGSDESLFFVPDGGTVEIINPDGTSSVAVVSYVDALHFEMAGHVFDINVYSDFVKANGGLTRPARLLKEDVRRIFSRIDPNEFVSGAEALWFSRYLLKHAEDRTEQGK